MKMISMDIEVLSAERTFDERSSPAGSKNNSNPIPTRRDSNNTNDLTVHPKRTRAMFPSSMLSLNSGACIFVIFISINMFIGILIIYFASPKPLDKTCTFILKSEALSSVSVDSHPNSIAVGDLNNDGLLDIVVPNSETHNVGVFVRDSNNTFKNQMVYSTGPRSVPYAVTVADFNNDRRLDIAVANFGTNNVGIFLGTDNGTFKSQTAFSTRSSRPRYVATGDFNNDAIIDIAVVNYGTNDIGIFLGDGRGNFGNWTTFSTGFDSIPYSLAIAHLNHDSQLDLVVANYGTKNVGVLLGYGNGSFASQTTLHIGRNSQPYSVTAADLNNDTHIDIIVASSNTNNIAVLLGLGSGLFSAPSEYFTGNNSSPHSLAIGNFDDDNEIDIAVATESTSSVTIFFGRGNGTFSDQIMFYNSSDSHPYSIDTGDFNNDTRLDIAVVDYDYNFVSIVLTYRNYSFLSPIPYRTTGFPSNPQSIAVADLNKDNRLDIIVVNYAGSNIDVFFGYDNGTFSNQTSYSTGIKSGPSSIAMGDFNNDSRIDMVVANYLDGNIGVFLGSDDESFSNQTTYPTEWNSPPYAVDVGDLNNNGRLDIVVVSQENNSIGLFFGSGDGTFSSQEKHPMGSRCSPVSVNIAHFNNDNRLDIVVVCSDSGNIDLFFGYDDDTFSYQTVFSTGFGAGPNGAAIADLNGDGRMDIVVNIYYNRAFEVLLGQGNGTFVSKTRYSVGSVDRPSWCTIADWNNDQQLDIIVSSCDTDNILMFVGYGDGTFSRGRTYSTGSYSCPLSSAAGDFNHDRLQDIVVANSNTDEIDVFLGFTYMNGIREATYPTGSTPHPQAIVLGHFTDDLQLDIVMANYGLGNVGFLQGHSNGTFLSQTMFSTGALSFPTSLTIGDLNNDSKLDVVVANSIAGNVGILYGYGNGTFASQQTYSTGVDSLSQSVVSADFNNDKKLDIAVVYSGSNSVSAMLRYDTAVFQRQKEYFTGTSSYPHAVAVGDFNNDSWPDFVAVNRGSQSISIFLGLGNGTFSNPTSYEAGKGSASYAVVVDYINNDSCLDIVVSHYHINAVSLFLGLGNGTFSNATIYPTADPCAPVGIATGDFNYDNRLDLVVVCNTENSTINILLGRDNGTFSDAVTYSTGKNTYPMYAAVADFNHDNHLDIVVANTAASNITLFQGHGDGTFFMVGSYSTGNVAFPRPIAVADLDKDGQLDVVVGNSGSDNVCVFFGYGNSSFSDPVFHPIENGSLSYGLVISDFNSDDRLDIAVANYGTNDIAILLGLTNRTFFNPLTHSTGDSSQPSYLAVADFNHDHRLDIVVPNSGIDSVSVFLGYTSEDFLIAPAYVLESSSQLMSIAVGDFDNDTQMDLVVVDNATNNVMIVFGSGDGTFNRQTTHSTGTDSHPRSVAVADLNNDNRLDMVVANSGTDNISVFLADSSGAFLSQMVYFTGLRSQPCAVAIGDFDNDTRLDIAVANEGVSSVGVFLGLGNGSFSNQLIFYTGFGSLPFALAIGDVNNDHLTDIVAANNGYGNIAIVMKTC